MADGSIVFDTSLDNKTLERQLNSLKRKVQSLNDQIYTSKQQQIPLLSQSKQLSAQLDAAKATLYEMQTAPTKFGDNAILRQKETVDSLQAQWNSVQNRVESYARNIEKSTVELDLAKSKAGAIEQSLSQAAPETEKMAKATDKMNKNASKFVLRLKEVIRSALVFTLISQAFASLREWLGRVIQTNEEAAEAIANLKGALLTLAQPIISVVIPALAEFLRLLTNVIMAIANIVSMLFGSTIDESKEAAESLYDEQKALEGVGGAAKSASKNLAGFDEINKLSGGLSGGGGGASVDGIGANFDIYGDKIKSKLDIITAYVSGALLAIGAILTFSGANIPLGISLMAAGAIGLVTLLTTNWGAMDSKLLNTIETIMLVLTTAFLVIGAILFFTSASPGLGVSLMVAGITGLAAASIIDWSFCSEKLKGVIGILLSILMTALLVIGGIMTFSGTFVAQGIALMAAGAAGLVTVMSINWSWIQEKLQNTWTAIAALIVGVVLVIIGLILAFTGAALPLGIGMIIVGGITLAADAAANWGWLQEKLVSAWTPITKLLTGAVLAVIGMILVCTGVGVPLGIGMIVAGGVALASITDADWGWLLDKLKSVWNDIKNWWNTNVKKFFTADWWADLGKSMVDGLLGGLKSAWDSVTSWVSDAVGWIKDLFGGASDSISDVGDKAQNLAKQAQMSKVSRSNLKAVPSLRSIPGLASGSVIPPNREFLAVLGDQKSGTNVEAPLATVEQALINALNRTGYTGGQQEAIFEVDGQTFAKLVYKYNSREGRRVGVTMSEA